MHVDGDPLIWIQCVIYYTYLYLFHAGIDNARNATKIENPAFDAREKLDMSNLFIFYSFQIMWLLLLIGLYIYIHIFIYVCVCA